MSLIKPLWTSSTAGLEATIAEELAFTTCAGLPTTVLLLSNDTLFVKA